MKKLYGVTVALITPMLENTQEVDYDTLARHVEWLIQKGVNCIYCCGTDAEMYHLTIEERKKIAEVVVTTANKRIVVYVHCGAMLESDTLLLVKHAEMIGVDGIGVITPSYFPTNDKELERYYVEIAHSVKQDFPVYIYNIPQLSANDIKPEVVQKIANACPNVVGIKYNYPNINQTFDYTLINEGSFSVLQGDDRVLPAWLSIGCAGTVAGSANVFPEPLVACYHSFINGNLNDALYYSRIAAECVDALQGDNIAYFKEGLNIRGIHVGTMRKPLLKLDDNEVWNLRKKMETISHKYQLPLQINQER